MIKHEAKHWRNRGRLINCRFVEVYRFKELKTKIGKHTLWGQQIALPLVVEKKQEGNYLYDLDGKRAT